MFHNQGCSVRSRIWKCDCGAWRLCPECENFEMWSQHGDTCNGRLVNPQPLVEGVL